jgi:hypothetical protein
MKGKVVGFDFAGEKPQSYEAVQQGQQQPQQQAPAQGFNDLDDEKIPF